MSTIRLLVVLAWTFALLKASFLFASTYLDVADEIYYNFSRLEAEGIITSGLLSTKPMSRKEAIRLLHEAESKSAGSSEFINDLIRSLREQLKIEESSRTAGTMYIKYVNTNSQVHALT